jgi:predicted chitinase
MVAVAWWENKIPDAIMNCVKKVTRVVNGGYHGLPDRQKLQSIAQKKLA